MCRALGSRYQMLFLPINSQELSVLLIEVNTATLVAVQPFYCPRAAFVLHDTLRHGLLLLHHSLPLHLQFLAMQLFWFDNIHGMCYSHARLSLLL